MLHADKTRALEAGDRIGEVNGKKVGTIQEFRDAVRDGQKSGYITLKTRNTETFIALPYGKTLTDEDRLSRIYQYSVTPFVKDLQKQHNNNQGSSK